ncbi:uncharacterized protein L3040_000456 [Drepanopeziza brunnea f. sp. 'multigermtubi']|uniref:Zinc knuckle protein n=1 Tax=Marssonina brunnea f. sp. multigermtubi (strain MB_m1) TaxID=1072389 RepID=K1WVE8_MARBU|nr:zinc knuckle protein [Drepanopeziza brunnea f. sp. 'multigermtubi' MB_m1]EKD17016.1 zinc knuckle protein [Drepanopeziza brunnea f. sp. 'multigermtubi' MB_m1]KAJ5054174.1 hypothetical protein L3040_000456 [Drepanopeziza brunnea f. sp. 'multigermtubi']
MADSQQQPVNASLGYAQGQPATHGSDIALNETAIEPNLQFPQSGPAAPTDHDTEDSRTQLTGRKRTLQGSAADDDAYKVPDHERSRKRLKDRQELSPVRQGLLAGIASSSEVPVPADCEVGSSQQPAPAGQASVSTQLQDEAEKTRAPGAQALSLSSFVGNGHGFSTENSAAQTAAHSPPPDPSLKAVPRSFEPFQKLSTDQEANLTGEEKGRYLKALFTDSNPSSKEAPRSAVTMVSRELPNSLEDAYGNPAVTNDSRKAIQNLPSHPAPPPIKRHGRKKLQKVAVNVGTTAHPATSQSDQLRDKLTDYLDATRLAEAAIATDFPLPETQREIKSKISKGLTLYPRQPPKVPEYVSREGKYILSEVFDPVGKPFRVDEFSFEIFASLFLKRHPGASLTDRELKGAFGTYVNVFYSHMTSPPFGPVLNTCLTTAKPSKAAKVLANSLITGEEPAPKSTAVVEVSARPGVDALLPPVHTAIAVLETKFNAENASNEVDIAMGEITTTVEDTDLDLKKVQLFLQQKYFPSKSLTIQHCLACSRIGHNNSTCPYMRCSTCGVGLHSDSTCPKKKRCSKCREVGHQPDKCPEKLSLPRSEMSCDICGSSDHLETRCHQVWRSFDANSQNILKVQHIPSNCYNCGGDHLGPDCALQRGPIYSGGVTWSKPNLLKYIDSTSKTSALSAVMDYSIPSKAPRTGRVNDPIMIDEDIDDDESFIRPSVQKNHPARGSFKFNMQGPNSDKGIHFPKDDRKLIPPKNMNSERKPLKKKKKKKKKAKQPPLPEPKAPKSKKAKKGKNSGGGGGA